MAGAQGAAAVLANAQTCAVIGLDGYVVQVEVDISPGLPVFKNAGTQTHQGFGQIVEAVFVQSAV